MPVITDNIDNVGNEYTLNLATTRQIKNTNMQKAAYALEPKCQRKMIRLGRIKKHTPVKNRIEINPNMPLPPAPGSGPP